MVYFTASFTIYALLMTGEVGLVVWILQAWPHNNSETEKCDHDVILIETKRTPAQTLVQRQDLLDSSSRTLPPFRVRNQARLSRKRLHNSDL